MGQAQSVCWESKHATRRTTLPICTLIFVAIALLVSLGPGARLWTDALIFRRAAIEAGEFHRLWTANLVHGWPSLAVWDLGAVFLLGTWLERRSRVRLLTTIVASGLLAGAAVLFARPDLELYEGSSAIASGLYVAVAASLWRENPSRAARVVVGVSLGGFVLKVALETAGLWPSPAASGSSQVVLVPVAHAAGALGGLLGIRRTTWT